jgi:hypothetical protein
MVGVEGTAFSSSSPILANAFSDLGREFEACDHSELVPASKKPEHCANISRCSMYLFSCPSALIMTSTSPVCAKKGNSFCGWYEEPP